MRDQTGLLQEPSYPPPPLPVPLPFISPPLPCVLALQHVVLGRKEEGKTEAGGGEGDEVGMEVGGGGQVNEVSDGKGRGSGGGGLKSPKMIQSL